MSAKASIPKSRLLHVTTRAAWRAWLKANYTSHTEIWLVYYRKGSGKRKVMIAGHMDEIGFIVTHIDSNGFIRFQPCGGFDPRTMMSQRVYVHTARQRLMGVMGTKPIHVLTDDEKKKTLQVTD